MPHDVNSKLANLFLAMAASLQSNGANAYRVRAYTRAADTIAHLENPVTTLVDDGNVQTLPGIGKDLAAKIHEYVATGTIQAYEELKTPLPPDVRPWAALPGLSEPIVHELYHRLGIRTLDDLEVLARSHMLRTRPGVTVTAEELIAAIQRVRARFPTH